MHVAFQMDPLDTLHKDSDTSLCLIEEGIKQGHSLYYYTPESMAYAEGEIKAFLIPLSYKGEEIAPHKGYMARRIETTKARVSAIFPISAITVSCLRCHKHQHHWA